mmetsp:Transcript_723/g.1530  ORF Transcript_723/g.1530 Transcript_723/m.1530 type:complete len:311 (-) Transcript_723:227-1159(-)
MRSPTAASLTRRAMQLLSTSTPAPKTNSAFKMSAARVRQIHSRASSVHSSLLRDLRELDTSSLCDAHKATKADSDPESSIQIHLMNGTIRPMNHLAPQHNNGRVVSTTMAGVARVVSFTEPNDFLPVMRALALEAEADEVLVVDTKSSTRAVAGEIFVNEAGRKGLAGIVIDGPIRDTAHLDTSHRCADHGTGESNPSAPAVRIYATGVTPYSGTTQSPGDMQPAVVSCGGVDVRPGDIVVGDNDGVLVGEADAFSKLVPVAQNIQHIESELIAEIASPEGGRSLASMTNLEEHVRHRLEGKSSNLEFRI